MKLQLLRRRHILVFVLFFAYLWGTILPVTATDYTHATLTYESRNTYYAYDEEEKEVQESSIMSNFNDFIDIMLIVIIILGFISILSKIYGDRITEHAMIQKILQFNFEFSPEEFKLMASEMWSTIQRALAEQDMDTLWKLESKSLFKIHQEKVQRNIDLKRTVILEEMNVHKVYIQMYKNSGTQESILVKLKASYLNYVKEERTGKILFGDDKHVKKITYRVEFVRSLHEEEPTKEMNLSNCPNCGAPLTIDCEQCEYCKSKFTLEERTGWVVNKYEIW